MVEEGTLLPEQKLLTPGLPREVEVSFEIVSGSARFQEGDGRVVTHPAQEGSITLPAIKPGAVHDESLVRVTRQGVPLMRELRVSTLPPGGVASLVAHFASNRQALVASDTHHIVIDENRLTIGDDGIQTQVKSAFQVPGIERPVGDSEVSAAQVCIRAAWGPGQVNWGMSYPPGLGFSVKPESAYNLAWGQAPSQSIDGIYNRSWGCGYAVKVPDSCTANVAYNGAISCCCNATLAALGYVCQWANPGAIGWPNCPL